MQAADDAHSRKGLQLKSPKYFDHAATPLELELKNNLTP
jgi:hypothetical protein